MQPTIDLAAEVACPIPLTDYPNVLLAHGGGGRLMRQLIGRMFLPAFDNPALNLGHDGAILDLGGLKLAFTTDSFVVDPLFFPGGDIGTLAVYGTANDLAMCGAQPLYLSAGFVLEEGLPMDILWRVVRSMENSAAQVGVQFVTGDTKVVDRGKGDKVYINTAGIGVISEGVDINPKRVRPGDVILLSGDIGRHGMAIMATREGLEFENFIESDCAPVAEMVMGLLDAAIEVHCLRDLTRGGLASALVEIAEDAELSVSIEERAIPVDEQVDAACEILGLDALYVANEGRFIAFVSPDDADRALAILRDHPLGHNAAIIGEVSARDTGMVTIRTLIGANRIVDMLSGEQLPRIC